MERADAASRVKAWTRSRFGDVTVLVTELESAAPGLPPLHTVVAFWTGERRPYHFKIFKPLQEVAEEDLPSRAGRRFAARARFISCRPEPTSGC